MDDKLIKDYLRLLKELSGHPGYKFPEKILPAPKKRLIQEIEHKSILSGPQDNESLQQSLEMFSPGINEMGGFLVGLVISPFFLSLFYCAWVVFREASIVWLLAPVLLLVGSSVCLGMRMLDHDKGFIKSLFLAVVEFITVSAYAAIFFRLVVYSGFYGVYLSTIKGFSAFGLISSLIALYFGHHYTTRINRLHYFLSVNKYRGETIQQASVSPQ